MVKHRIVIIGAGNVATHLAAALDAAPGCDVIQVFSPNQAHASAIASVLRQSSYTNHPAEIVTDADFYIVAVKDDAISTLPSTLPHLHGIVAHTSGSVPIDALAGISAGYGVFYPLQTFSRTAKLDISEVPFFIEGSDTDTTEALMSLARLISNNVTDADSSKRAILHLAAVFACNFTNYMWDIASGILNAHGIRFSVFAPLLRQTLDKALSMPPYDAQTGPAMRADVAVIQRQEALLPDDKKLIYNLISAAIMRQHNISTE